MCVYLSLSLSLYLRLSLFGIEGYRSLFRPQLFSREPPTTNWSVPAKKEEAGNKKGEWGVTGSQLRKKIDKK
jgi:hypothetical protein